MINKAIIFLNTLLLTTTASAVGTVNDLSHLMVQQFDIDVFVKPSRDVNGNSRTVVGFYIEHPYTNTLSCSIRAFVPAISSTGEEKIIGVNIPEILIFPKLAFPDQRLSYELNISELMEEGDQAKLNYQRVQRKSAKCKGLSPGFRLPAQVCAELNQNHEQVCRDNARNREDKYGLNVNNQFIGICNCN